MKTFVIHKMLALSLNTQAKLDKQIIRDRHDAILNSFVLNMKQMLIDKEFVEYNKSYNETHPAAPDIARSVNNALLDIKIVLESVPTDICEYFNTCAKLVNQISAKLINIITTLV